MRRSTLLAFGIATLPLVGGCYGSRGEEGGDDAGAEDAVTADEAAPGEDAGAEDAAAEVEAEADAMPDSTVECPPLMDGTWVDFTIDGPTFEAVDVETPCRMNMVVGGPPGHEVVRLECGTGAAMTIYTIDFFANPPVYLAFWEGAEVTLRYVADPVWWIDQWFTVRDPSGNLLFRHQRQPPRAVGRGPGCLVRAAESPPWAGSAPRRTRAAAARAAGWMSLSRTAAS